MTRTVKKALAVFLLLCLVAAWLPAAALAAAEVSASAEGNLTAGSDSGTITVTATGSDFNEQPAQNLFSIESDVGASLTVTAVNATANRAELTISGTPTRPGPLTVKIQAAAFANPPSAEVSAEGATVKGASVTAKYTGSTLTAGTQGQITVTADGCDFEESPNADYFKLEGCGVTKPDRVEASNTNATLYVTPAQRGEITVKSIEATAFQYQPDDAVTPSGTPISVQAPTVTATVTNTSITAGKEGNIVVTAEGSNFKADLNDPTKFTLEGCGAAPTKVVVATNTATLTVKPTSSGTIKVTKISADAFQYQPADDVTLSEQNTVTVNAPTVTLKAEPSSITAGDTDKVTVTINEDDVKFASDVTGKFSVSGIEGVNNVTGVTITGSGSTDKTAQITLNAVPTTSGELTITVEKEAFTPVAAGNATATVTVNAPTGGVKAALTGSLTAGTAAGSTTITLTATDTLNFKDSPEPSAFTLASSTGDIGDLKVSKVNYSGPKSISLDLTGTPKAGGDFTIKVNQDAFVAKTQEGTDIQATGDLEIGYPEITLTADKNEIVEGTEATVILTANGGKFKLASGTGDSLFTLEGDAATGTSITAVNAVEGAGTVTLTLAAPSKTGALTIKVQPAAFQYAPETAVSTSITVKAPEASVTTDSTLTAGTAGGSIVLTADGDSFAASPATSLFVLSGDSSSDLTVSKVEASGKTATLTLSGTPSKAGTLTITIGPSAFEPAAAEAVTVTVTIGQPNVKLTVGANALQAGKADGSVTLTLSGSAFADGASGQITLNADAFSGDGLTLGDVKVDGTSVTVTVKGTPSIMGNITLTFATAAFTPAPEKAVSVTVPVAKGEQTAVPETETGAPGIGLTAPVDELASAVLSPEDQALYEQGAEVKIELVESPGTQVPASDKTAVEAVAGEYTVGEYLDVSLIKTINGESGPVTETNKPIQVVFTIPTDLRAADREFAVIRVHDGKAEFLKTVASTADTITVESDLFSTYAIVYQSKPEESPAPDDTPAPDSTPAPDDTGDRAPDTGDATPIMGWLALLLSCGAALILVLASKRRREH